MTKARRQDQACDAQGEGEKVTVHGWPLPLWNDRRIWPAIGKDGVNQAGGDRFSALQQIAACAKYLGDASWRKIIAW